MKDIYQGIWADGEPLDFYEMLLTRDINKVMVHETNLYAAQKLTLGDLDVKKNQGYILENQYMFLAFEITGGNTEKEMKMVKKKRSPAALKPTAIVDYNGGESFISDQMVS
ncbi:hypothetical protein EVAR_98015_1 [Eumeta japonica]|uniref:PiggyBac transposable element-derived protein domain-containing protein n=1 Tax=Eumeta variegata TaxID=151549 RepID=A0A4C1WIY8_EUMVA|nr:hypothetical protein EVAR_98015_1 [Eumeta japonica]